ncbi:hypothetical protein WHI96_08030 [Pseudonocardia tropica]|uniref:Uncharacterized protein n=1 Tax=Pseudonocardia tropica TaxID=681289 RepID=A0ABV1JS54_9PSEU
MSERLTRHSPEPTRVPHPVLIVGGGWLVGFVLALGLCVAIGVSTPIASTGTGQVVASLVGVVLGGVLPTAGACVAGAVVMAYVRPEAS